jgi:DNA-binding FadR family transcriptional regulator
VREALEGISARLASLKANESDLHKIECAVERMEESLKKEKGVDIEAYNNADNEFHRLIVEASHNKKLKDLASMCHMHVDDFLPETTRTEFFEEEYKNVLEKHREILTAIKDRNGDLAEELIRKHISASKKIAETFFEKSGESNKGRIF